MDIDLTIPFEFPVPAEDMNIEEDILTERFAFWDSPTTFKWFEARGYTLYKRMPTGEDDLVPNFYTVPQLASPNVVEAEYPYPYHENYTQCNAEEYTRCVKDFSVESSSLFSLKVIHLPHSFGLQGKVAFAQDTQLRHVAIKLVTEGTDELRILQLLSRQSPQTLRENCLIPVLGFLPIEGFCFVIMPRWGTSVHLPRFETTTNVVQVMHSMLKGLTFLHGLNIVHRDLCLRNVLVNHFSSDHSKHHNPWRAELRQAGSLLHAIFDFDLSVIAPPDAKKSEFRLPYDMSWCGSYNQPFDTAQGEFDYDPFAFDVGTMGREFCNWFQVRTFIVVSF
ncbi:hypothetical protein NLJ89_g7192 [Agrocybe chaxingu]|uniref:Protein kinase domain-containing protein n=1 Tax=Agrocybe chaxingu TaxID=84603 RepID=A0A9W8MTX7_9AGAR|nr:hypothetical protein NLJ89_g7192 [Agrocybe chaxingu]